MAATKLAKRDGLDNPGEGGCKPPDNECASPNPERGEPNGLVKLKSLVANLPEEAKPELTGKKRTKAPVRLTGVTRESACRKNISKEGRPA